MARWRRLTSAAGLAAGVAAAGVGAVIAAEKIAVGRLRVQPDPAAHEPFGQLRGLPVAVLADDGVPLHAEVSGLDEAPVTIVFCHGYTLSQDVWHYQRRDLADYARLVFWDQRGHGRSGRSDLEHTSIDQLGSDLAAIVAATAPGSGPVVLVGHSMGGMTIMALASQRPELFGTKVTGVVLISTAASMVDPTAWMPAPLRLPARWVAPAVLRGSSRGRRADLVDRARQAAGDLAFLATRFIAFADPDASPTAVDFLERLIRATPIDVVADFYLALHDHDKVEAIRVLGNVPTVVLAGADDKLVPRWQSEELAAGIPGARLVVVPGTGHAIILERPEAVTEEIADLVAVTLEQQPDRRRRA
jgi:pimeloyl-ACP methyl ester carboxylesterase